AWLRENGGTEISAGRLAADARRLPGPAGAPEFGSRLSRLLDVLWQSPRRRSYGRWSEAFARALEAAGWPGDAPLDSAEYQATGAWAELLDELAALDAVSGPASLQEACGRLRRMATERLFQPESAEVPVQVLGLFEAAGLQFEGIWVAGLHDGVLPAPLAPSPFIPAGLQRARGMPRADPETEHRLARLRLERLAASAAEVVFSWPRRSGDEPLRPSPVLKGLPEALPAGTAPPLLPVLQRNSASLESVADEAGPSCSGPIRGGTGLLRAYSACPFQAFGRYRLRCEPLAQPTPGVNPMARGEILHEALQVLWAELGDSDTLAGMDAADRRRRVEAAVDAGMARAAAGGSLPDQPALLAIEKVQAVARIEGLLELELRRPPFEVIRREEWLELPVGALVLKGRVDRVDQVPGGMAVIDYKAGESRRSDWYGERPREPQLPLYAVTLPEVVAVAFANLKPGRVGYQGLARDAEAMGLVKPARKDHGPPEWEALLAEWRETLAGLAAGVAAGNARVAPRQGRVTCEYCGLQVLCRREELAAEGAIGDD
ncbi:MAG: PD-(D/E)XK nuclease family protein, partial [Gammaproteobacteria bacterium]